MFIICSFQEHQDQLIQGSYNSSEGVRKERRKGRKPTRVRKLTVLREQAAGPHFSQEDSEELAPSLALDDQRYWSSWDEDVWAVRRHTLTRADVCALSYPDHAQGSGTRLVSVRTPLQGWWGEWEGERRGRRDPLKFHESSQALMSKIMRVLR